MRHARRFRRRRLRVGESRRAYFLDDVSRQPNAACAAASSERRVFPFEVAGATSRVRAGFSNWNISDTARVAFVFAPFFSPFDFENPAPAFRAVNRNTAAGRLASRYRPGQDRRELRLRERDVAARRDRTRDVRVRGPRVQRAVRAPGPVRGRTRRRGSAEARFARFAPAASSPSFSHPRCASSEDSTVARPSTRTAANVCAAGACVCVPGRRCHRAKSPRYVRPSVPAPMPPSGAPAASPSSTHLPRHRGGPRESGGSPMGWLHATASGMPESSSGEGGGAAAATTRSASASARSAARRPIAPAPGRSDE